MGHLAFLKYEHLYSNVNCSLCKNVKCLVFSFFLIFETPYREIVIKPSDGGYLTSREAAWRNGLTNVFVAKGAKEPLMGVQRCLL